MGKMVVALTMRQKQSIYTMVKWVSADAVQRKTRIFGDHESGIARTDIATPPQKLAL
jgi:hypothetical protein